MKATSKLQPLHPSAERPLPRGAWELLVRSVGRASIRERASTALYGLVCFICPLPHADVCFICPFPHEACLESTLYCKMNNTGCIHWEKMTLDAYSRSVLCSALLFTPMTFKPWKEQFPLSWSLTVCEQSNWRMMG